MRVLLPAPGGPVMPTVVALPVRWKRLLRSSTEEGCRFSMSVAALAIARGLSSGSNGLGTVGSRDVIVHHSDERLDDGVATERGSELAVDIDGCDGFLKCAGQRDADVRVLGLTGSVDDATHDRDLHLFDSGVLLFPVRHLLAQVGLDLVGHVLE